MSDEVLIWLCVVGVVVIAAVMYATKDFINWYGHWDDEDVSERKE